MNTKKFKPILIEPAQNGVIVYEKEGQVGFAEEPPFVFTSFVELTAHIRSSIVFNLDIDDLLEHSYWRFDSLVNGLGENPKLTQRDAFKRIFRDLLLRQDDASL